MLRAAPAESAAILSGLLGERTVPRLKAVSLCSKNLLRYFVGARYVLPKGREYARKPGLPHERRKSRSLTGIQARLARGAESLCADGCN